MNLEDAMLLERDLMLIRREPSSEGEWHGLVLPESARKSDHVVAVVLGCGPYAPFDSGQRIVTARKAGTGLALQDGQELAIIVPGDVLALLPGEEAA